MFNVHLVREGNKCYSSIKRKERETKQHVRGPLIHKVEDQGLDLGPMTSSSVLFGPLCSVLLLSVLSVYK